MSTDVAIRNPIAVPPALAEAGVTVTEEHGVRSVMIPDTLKQRYNIAQPVSEVTQADPDWSPRLVVVDLSGEQYHYNEQGKRSLTKVGILLLAHAAGIEVAVEMIPRALLRDSEIGYKATATIRRSDGTLARWEASKVSDLDDEKAAIAGTNKKWPVEKAHLPAKTESKAILRAVSLALQLKRGGYLPAEMLKPFLIVGVSSTPSDPDVRRMRALSAAGDLYGARALALAPVSEPDLESSQYAEPTPTQQLPPPADVVDIKPSLTAGEPEPERPLVQGEITAAVAAAGEVIVPTPLKPAGRRVDELDVRYLEYLAGTMADGSPNPKAFNVPAPQDCAPGEDVEAYRAVKAAAQVFLPWRVANPMEVQR